jgi:uncharacterized membrane protein
LAWIKGRFTQWSKSGIKSAHSHWFLAYGENIFGVQRVTANTFVKKFSTPEEVRNFYVYPPPNASVNITYEIVD